MEITFGSSYVEVWEIDGSRNWLKGHFHGHFLPI